MAEANGMSNAEQPVAEEEVLAGQAVLDPLLYGFVGSFVLRAVVMLGLPDIIAKASPDETLTLKQIAAQLKSESVKDSQLQRLLAAAVYYKIFRCTKAEKLSEMQYGLTPASKLIVTGNNFYDQAPKVLFTTNPTGQAAWQQLHRCVLYGDDAWQCAHGKDVWNHFKDDPEIGKEFNAWMVAVSSTELISLTKYEGFKDIKTLVDVGGGFGKSLEIIVSSYPHIHGINYDQPHVIADAPTMPGIEHVGGNMFESVPSGDAIFMKRIMHDWNDENCLKILRNCQKALPEKGKVLIHEYVVQPSGGMPLIYDVLMMVYCVGGMERTEEQWRNLLTTANFSTVNFIPLVSHKWLIEAIK